jgi:hypothetical protein
MFWPVVRPCQGWKGECITWEVLERFCRLDPAKLMTVHLVTGMAAEVPILDRLISTQASRMTPGGPLTFRN